MLLPHFAFIGSKQHSVRALFSDDSVKFPISKGGAFVNKRGTAINTLTERLVAVMVLFLFALTTAYLLSQVDVFDFEQPHRNNSCRWSLCRQTHRTDSYAWYARRSHQESVCL